MKVGHAGAGGGRAAILAAFASLAAWATFAAFTAVTLHGAPAGAQGGGHPPAGVPGAGQPAPGAPGATQPVGGAPPAGAPATAAPTQPSAVPPMTVTSQPSVLEEDIRDIRGPKYLAPVWLIPAVVAGAVALMLVGYGIWRWTRRRRAPRVLSSSETALQRLEEIRVLMQPATVREFSIEVSDVVRVYIERGFDITATHRTTEEFLRDLLETTHPALIGHRDLLAGFLEQCDLAKFAGMSLSSQSMEALHASARSFVIESSKPIAAPPPAAKTAPSVPAAGGPAAGVPATGVPAAGKPPLASGTRPV